MSASWLASLHAGSPTSFHHTCTTVGHLPLSLSPRIVPRNQFVFIHVRVLMKNPHRILGKICSSLVSEDQFIGRFEYHPLHKSPQFTFVPRILEKNDFYSVSPSLRNPRMLHRSASLWRFWCLWLINPLRRIRYFMDLRYPSIPFVPQKCKKSDFYSSLLDTGILDALPYSPFTISHYPFSMTRQPYPPFISRFLCYKWSLSGFF